MATFTFSCPHCRQALQGSEQSAGQTLHCPGCGREIRIPSAAREAGPPPEAQAAGTPKRLTVQTHRCPICGARLDPGAAVCVQCGRDLRTGRPLDTHAPSKLKRSGPSTGRQIMRGVRSAIRTVVTLALLAGLAVTAVWLWYHYPFAPAGPDSRASAAGKATPPPPSEPDWQARYQEWRTTSLGIFQPVETGTPAEVIMKVGGRMSGILLAVTSNEVVLRQGDAESGCLRHAMAPESRVRYFADDFASWRAQREVRREQAEWRAGTFNAPPRPLTPAPEPGTSATSPPPPGTHTAAPAPAQERRVICPLCRGEGAYMARAATAGAAEPRREICPVCGGQGDRTLTLPEPDPSRPGFQWETCPDCGGMGRVARDERVGGGTVKKAGICVRCIGRGLVHRAR